MKKSLNFIFWVIIFIMIFCNFSKYSVNAQNLLAKLNIDSVNTKIEQNKIFVSARIVNTVDLFSISDNFCCLYANGKMIDIKLTHLEINSNEKINLQWQFNNINGSNNYYVKIFNWDSLHNMKPVSNTIFIEPKETVYFLVAEKGKPLHSDSYILPLSAKESIEYARLIISNPNLAPAQIIFAEIDRGNSDGIICNNDLIGGTKLNWHIKNFIGFGEMGIEILDGWPLYVNDNLEDWMSQTGGRIGFWNYTIIREVQLSEIHNLKY